MWRRDRGKAPGEVSVRTPWGQALNDDGRDRAGAVGVG